MPPLYYFPSEDCCPRRKLRVQGGWRHEWRVPESTLPREVVRGPFSKPLLVSSTPFVLLNEADSGRKLGHTRTGIPDPWAEYLAQQTQGRSRLGEENVAIVDTAYHKWGVPFCQGIPDPWRNRPCFLEASFDELQKYDHISPCDCAKRPSNKGNIPLHHVTREYPGKHDDIPTCEPANCPSLPQQHNCKCTTTKLPQQFTQQLQEKTAQTLYDVSPEQICSCDLQQNVPIQIPNKETSLKPQEGPLSREMFKSCHCKGTEPRATWIQPTPPSTNTESKKKRRCPISKCFRRPKKTQTSPTESPNKNITKQDYSPVAVPNSKPVGDGQKLLLLCLQNCKCKSTPYKLMRTSVQLRDSTQKQLPRVCQCAHTDVSSTNDITNNLEKLLSSESNLQTILPCPFDENTGTSEKYRNDTKSPQSETIVEKLHTPGMHEPQNADANKHAKKSKFNLANKQSDTSDLEGTDDEVDTHFHGEDERNKGRYLIKPALACDDISISEKYII